MSMNLFARKYTEEKANFHSNPAAKLTLEELENSDTKYQTKPVSTSGSLSKPSAIDIDGRRNDERMSSDELAKASIGTDQTSFPYSKGTHERSQGMLSSLNEGIYGYKKKFSATPISFSQIQFDTLNIDPIHKKDLVEIHEEEYETDMEMKQTAIKRKLFETDSKTQTVPNSFKMHTDTKILFQHKEQQHFEDKYYKSRTSQKKYSAIQEVRNLYKENRDVNFQYRKEKFIHLLMKKPISIAVKLEYDRENRLQY